MDDLEAAQALVTLKTYYRRRPRLIVDAERMGVSIYVLRANTATQVEDFLVDIFDLYHDSPQDDAPLTAKPSARPKRPSGACAAGNAPWTCRQQDAYIRRKQHDMARAAHLVSHSYGTEPNRRVRIFRDEAARSVGPGPVSPKPQFS
ncbi:MAG: hypothetical protein KatS3mg051_0682 [Anaerolineae bacterium]|nr:MAG: hypothetical protein KatS3mg051_0682 [Anaerolineae bacterium]